jgi:putative colanic acid biosynthesis glycosyltransferase
MMALSVVTVHLNDFEGLEKTYRSIKKILQSPEIIWIFIDGGSQLITPQQKDVMDRVSNLAALFVSQPDNGIYDAMNKGTRLAQGGYVLYLNAGDELHPDFSSERIEAELGKSRPAMIWGTCFERFADGSLVKVKNRSPRLAWYGIPVNHQNVLFRRDTLGSTPYNETYRYCADYDLISRLLKQDGDVYRTAMPLAIYQRGGLSSINFLETMAEEESLRTLHFGLNRHCSKGISYLKRVNSKLGSIPAVRRLLRKWI